METEAVDGDILGGERTFIMIGGLMDILATDGPRFYQSPAAMIVLKGVNLTPDFIVLVRMTSGNWGNRSCNGGPVWFTARGQT